MVTSTISPVARHTGLTGRQHLLLGLVFLLALAVRGGHLWGQQQYNPLFASPVMDEQKHHEWAQSIAAGKGLPEPLAGRPFFRAPLYYYLLAGLYRLCGPSLLVARLAGCVLGAATCYLIARLGTTLGGLRVGCLSGILAAVYWPMVVFDAQLLTVGLELFLNVLLLVVLVRAAAGGSRVLFLLAGVVWGLAALTRPNVLALAPGVVLWLWSTGRWPANVGPRRPRGADATKSGAPAISRWWAPALLLLGAAVAILPITVRNRIVGGEWVLIASSGGVNFYIGNNPQSDGVAAIVPGTRADWDGGYADTHRIPERELGRPLKEGEVSDYWYRRAWTWIRTDPLAWLRLVWLKLRLSFSPVELYNNQPTHFFARLSPLSAVYWVGFPVAACLGIAGLTVLTRQGRGWCLVLIYGVTYLATLLAFFTCDRYRLPFVPVLLLLSAAGLTRLPELWRARRWGRLGGYAAAGGLTAVFLATNPPERESYFRAEAGQAHHVLGVYYARLRATEPAAQKLAVAHLLETVRLRPGDTVMELSVAALLQQAGRADLAENQFRGVLAREPGNTGARWQYAGFLASAGRVEEAAVEYVRLAELQPDSLDTRLQLAFLLAKREDYAGALTQFDKILKREPGHVPTLLNSAAALGRMGRLDEAAARYRKVLEIDPQNADAAGALEHTLQRLGTSRAAPAREGP